MIRAIFFPALSVVALVSACAPGAASGDDDFTCAALISSADQLMASGKIAPEPAFQKSALLASMTYLNAWAIPAGLSEGDAFSQVKAERDHLIESSSPDDILKRAQSCVARTPNTGNSQ